MKFLGELRRIYKRLNNGETLIIDFSGTRRFIANGTLLFFAELTRLIEYGAGRIRLRCKQPMNDRASQVLEQIGVYGLCSHPSHGKPYLDDVVHWRVARGSDVDNSLCAPSIEEFDEKLTEPMVDGLLRGLGEAMTNAVHHAYMDTRNDGLNYPQPRHDWWMFSQSKDGFLSVVFCDLGVGIPTTLPVKKPWVYRTLEAIGLANSDADCINEAIKDSRSRTGQPGRGKGLGDILDVVSRLKHGAAAVYSNRGCYILNNNIHSSFNLKDSILGTLISWRIPLDGALKYGA